MSPTDLWGLRHQAAYQLPGGLLTGAALMNEDLKEFASPHRRGQPHRAIYRRGDQYRIRHPRLSKSRWHLDQAGTDRFLRLYRRR